MRGIALVNMEIEIEAVRLGRFEHLVERRVGRWPERLPKNVRPPSTPPWRATVSTIARNPASSFSVESIGKSATACNATRPFQVSRILENTGQEMAVCCDRVDMRAHRAGAVREGAA